MLIVLLLLAVLSPAAALAQNQTAIVGVTVIDVVESRTLPGMTVLIDRDRIANVAPASAVKLPTGTKTIDGAGKFLIPGLWDMHSHFTHDQSTLDLYVAYGVTTIRDMGSLAVKRTGDMTAESIPRDDAIKLDLQVRDEILSGKGFGPRIYSVGMIVTGGNAAEAGSHHIVVETPDAARAAVNKLADLRVDAIKVHARLTRESFFAIIDEAKKRALPVVGHTPLALNPIEVSEAGQKTIEHHTGIWEYAHKDVPKDDEEQARKRYAQEYETFKKNGTALVPTLVSYLAGAEAYGYITKPESNPYLDHVVPELALRWKMDWPASEFSEEQSKAFTRSVQTLQKMTKDMYDQGVTILAGTDIGGIYTYPGLDLHRELKLLTESGLTQLDVLRSATILPAQTVGAGDRSGSITAGKVADLVLLTANPLEDIANALNVEVVVLRGRVLQKSDLDGLRKKVAERAKPTLNILQQVPWLEE